MLREQEYLVYVRFSTDLIKNRDAHAACVSNKPRVQSARASPAATLLSSFWWLPGRTRLARE